MDTESRILPGCTVLPPMEQSNGMARRPNKPTRKTDTASKPKGKRSKATGQFAMLNAFLDFTICKLSRSEALVWLVLFRDTKRDGLARTAQADIARRIGADERTVKRAIIRLRKLKLVEVVKRGNLWTGPSAYRVEPVRRSR